MPFYPALPEYKPATAHPFTSLIGGFGAAQDVMGQMAKTKALREAADQPAREREAMQAAIAGDTTKLQTVNPQLFMKWSDNQRETASKAAEYISANAGFVKTPEQFDAFRNSFYKLFGNAVSPKFLPEKLTSPEQVQTVMGQGIEQSMDIQRRLAAAKGEQVVTTEKKLSKEVRMPETEHQFKLRKELQTQTETAHANLQRELADKRIGFEREIKEDQTKEKREQVLITNFRYEMNKLDEIEKTLELDIDKQMLPEEQAKMMKQELRLNMNAKRNRAADYYKPYADEYKIPWRPAREPEKPPADDKSADAARAIEILRKRGVIK